MTQTQNLMLQSLKLNEIFLFPIIILAVHSLNWLCAVHGKFTIVV